MTDSTQEWSIREVLYLNKLRHYCLEISTVMEKYYKRLSFHDKIIVIPSIILTSVSSLASFGSNQFGDSAKAIIPIAVGISSLVVTVLTSLNSYLEISINRNICKNAVREMRKLAKEIELELSVDIKDREYSGITFCRNCFSRIQTIYNTIPIIKLLKTEDVVTTIPVIDYYYDNAPGKNNPNKINTTPVEPENHDHDLDIPDEHETETVNSIIMGSNSGSVSSP